MKLLHTADLHIGAELSYLDSLADSRKYEVLEVFRNICTLCTKENVEFCLIAGDLFDSNTAASIFAEPVFRYMREAKTPTFYMLRATTTRLIPLRPLRISPCPKILPFSVRNTKRLNSPNSRSGQWAAPLVTPLWRLRMLPQCRRTDL